MPLRPVELQALWNLIPTPTTSQFNSFPFDGPLDGVRLAVDGIGNRHLLVELSSGEQIPPSRGLITESSQTLTFEGSTRAYLDVGLEEPGLEEEFNALICDVLSNDKASGTRAKLVHNALDRWRALLRLAASRIMSPERRLGLFGELIILERLRTSIDSPWLYWTGPLGAAHDFEMGAACVEAKTMGVGSSQIRIHGLNQLVPDAEELFLVIHVVSEDAAGRTLGDLANQLKREFAAPKFDALLARAGWSARLDPGPRLVVEETVTVPVLGSVPRLTPADVPTGVFAVDYDVELESLRPYASPRSLVTLLGFSKGTSE